MRPRTGSSLAALLLFGSLLAVPLLAVFGVPEFASVSASPTGEALREAPLLPIETRAGESLRYAPDDLFSPYAADEATAAAFTDPRAQEAPLRAGRSTLEPARGQRASEAARDLVELVPDARVPVRPVRSVYSENRNADLPPEALAGWEFADEPPQRMNARESAAPRPRTAGGDALQVTPASLQRRSPLNDPIFEASFEDPQPMERGHRQPPATARGASDSTGWSDAARTAADRTVSDRSAAAFADASIRTAPPARPSNPPPAARRDATPPPTAREAQAQRSAPGRSAAAAEPRSLTWNSAVERLKALGIREFRLSPGSRADTYHFSCFYTPRDNPRITQHFEDEADEPLRAVEKVLAQIEEWQKRRR